MSLEKALMIVASPYAAQKPCSVRARKAKPMVPLLVQIAKFLRTQVPPVTPDERTEIIVFMKAADISKKRGGRPVQLSEVMK